jgi:hypothetical protein
MSVVFAREKLDGDTQIHALQRAGGEVVMEGKVRDCGHVGLSEQRDGSLVLTNRMQLQGVLIDSLFFLLFQVSVTITMLLQEKK